MKKYAFFEDIDWVKLEKRELKPPFKPKLKSDADLRFFDRVKKLPICPNLMLNSKTFTEKAVKETPTQPGLIATSSYPDFTYQRS